MRFLDVDVAIIGAGTAGLTAYRTAKAAGASALIIEGGEYGTTCAGVGCMPSKLLIAAAETVHAIRKAPGFGIHIDGVLDINGREVMERVRRERDRFVSLMVRDILGFLDGDRIRGWAHLISDHTLLIDEHTRVTAKCIVIATGSHAAPWMHQLPPAAV